MSKNSPKRKPGYLVYFVQLKPFGEEERKNKEMVQSFQKQMIGRGLCGLGYTVSNVNVGDKGYTEERRASYKRLFDNQEHGKILNEETERIYRDLVTKKGDKGKGPAESTITRMLNPYKTFSCKYKQSKKGKTPKDIYIFTRLNNQECFVAKIDSQEETTVKFRDELSVEDARYFNGYENLTWTVNVKWEQLGTSSGLSRAINGKLSEKHQPAIKNIEGIAAWETMAIYEQNFNDDYTFEKKCVTVEDYYETLDPDTLEDLVAFYMRNQKCEEGEPQNWFVVPSSCKSNTPFIEFEMINTVNHDYITCQTKVNAKINLDAYIGNDELLNRYKAIYLFSGDGYELNKESVGENEAMEKLGGMAKGGTIKIVTKKDLYTFFKEDLSEKIREDLLCCLYSLT